MNDLFEQMKYTEGVEIFNLIYEWLDSFSFKITNSVAYLCNTMVSIEKTIVFQCLPKKFFENEAKFITSKEVVFENVLKFCIPKCLLN